MKNLFNHKLYEKYYPLVTEEDKQNLLQSDYIDIYKIVRNMGSIARNEIAAIQQEYVSQMKPTVSIFGTIKHKNVIHNEAVVHRMDTDKRIASIKEMVSRIDELSLKLANNECDKIELEELNYILKKVNNQRHKVIISFLILFIAIIFCVCIFL